MITLVTLLSIAAGDGWTPTFVALGIGVTAATFKEFVFDTASWGEGDSWSDSFMDWAFYMLGGAAGMAVSTLAHHLAGY